jgi:hypothetical protein
VAQQSGAPVLARLPIDPQAATLCDAGEIEAIVLPELNACVEALAQNQSADREAYVPSRTPF